METHSQDSWFERNPRKTLFLVTIISVFLFLITVDILIAPPSDSVGTEQSVSVVKRFIRLRELPPNLNSTVRLDDGDLKGTPNLTQEEYLLRTDGNGFVLPTEIHSNPDISIVFLGGSTTQCLFVNEKKRFPYLVGRLMEKRTKLKINSFNGGVSGNHTLHSINILINKVISMEPRYVVFMHNINDLVTLMYEGTYWNDNSSRGLIVETEAKKKADDPSWLRFFISLKDMLVPNVYDKLRSILDVRKMVGYNYREQGQGGEWANAKFIRLEKKKFLSLYERSLHTFIDISKNWNIVPVLMTQMNRIEDANKPPVNSNSLRTRLKKFGIALHDWIELYENMQFVTRRVAKERGVLMIDLDRRVPKDKKYIRDHVHLSTVGSELAAHIISQEILIDHDRNNR